MNRPRPRNVADQARLITKLLQSGYELLTLRPSCSMRPSDSMIFRERRERTMSTNPPPQVELILPETVRRCPIPSSTRTAAIMRRVGPFWRRQRRRAGCLIAGTPGRSSGPDACPVPHQG
jgi:hypothetical protein